MKVLQVTLDLLRILQEELEDVARQRGVCAVHCCNWCNLDPDKFATFNICGANYWTCFNLLSSIFKMFLIYCFKYIVLKKGLPLLGIKYPSKTWSCILMLPSFLKGSYCLCFLDSQWPLPIPLFICFDLQDLQQYLPSAERIRYQHAHITHSTPTVLNHFTALNIF